MADEDFKITIEGVEYRRLEDVPDKYRDLIRRQMEAALPAAESAAREAAGKAGNVQFKKHFEIRLSIKRPGAAPAPVPGDQPSIGAPAAESSRFRLLLLFLIVLGLIAWKLLRKK